MLRVPLRQNATSVLARARAASSLRTFQTPAQILLQQQQVQIHQKTPDQQLQPQSKEDRKDSQNHPKQAGHPNTQSKQQKDVKGAANKPVYHDKDDLDVIKGVLLAAIAELIHDTIHDCDE